MRAISQASNTSQMKLFFSIGFYYLLNVAFALDPLGSLVLMAPCFEVIKPTGCNSSLSSFQTRNPPAGINEPDTRTYLFTPSNKDRAEQLHLCNGLPPDTQYDPSLDTEIFIHGYYDGLCRTAWMREMKEQLFLRGKYNIILIDWSWGNIVDYIISAKNCKVVGEQVGFIINNIMRQKGVSPEKFHVIGHSLGAISSGFVGRSAPGLRRITALDPAIAPFLKGPPSDRLTYRDAHVVDVIHSNGGNCLVQALADKRFLGHADFYPNGGTVQLSCYTYLLESFLTGNYVHALLCLLPMLCYHTQSIQYYKASINSKGCQFIGVASKSYRSFLEERSNRKPCAVMGMDYELYRAKDDKTRRRYYLKTKLKCPYYDNSYLGQCQFPFNTSCSEDMS